VPDVGESFFLMKVVIMAGGKGTRVSSIANDIPKPMIPGDIIFDIDFSRMINFHREKKAQVTLAVHPNSHPFDSAVIFSNDNNQVTQWLN